MYEHILEKERQVLWAYGSVTCAAYPLEHIDTISETTGEINTNSAMFHIVQGVSAYKQLKKKSRPKFTVIYRF